MSKLEDLQTAFDEAMTTIDEATTEIGNDLVAQTEAIADLKSRLATGDPNAQAAFEAALAKITAHSERLKAMAQDAENPDPEAPPA